MGADMIIAACAVRKGDEKKIDFAAGRAFLEKMEITEEFVQDLVDNGDLWEDEEYFDENNRPKIENIRTWLLTHHHDFEQSFGGRDMSSLWVRDLTVFIVGGMSWGDSPEGCTAIWMMDKIPGVLTAMGFVEDYHLTAPEPVTPEEEAAAVESIKQAQPQDAR